MPNVNVIKEEKGVSLTIELKQVALDVDDTKFSSSLQETLDAIKSQMMDARAKYSASKAADVVGVPTLAEKGWSISVTYSL